MTMLGFVIIAMFAIAAAISVAVLIDSSMRGARAYRMLDARVRSGKQHNSVVFRIEQFERAPEETVFRARQVSRTIGARQISRRAAIALPVAA